MHFQSFFLKTFSMQMQIEKVKSELETKEIRSKLELERMKDQMEKRRTIKAIR